MIDIVVPGAKTMESLIKIDLPAGVDIDVNPEVRSSIKCSSLCGYDAGQVSDSFAETNNC